MKAKSFFMAAAIAIGIGQPASSQEISVQKLGPMSQIFGSVNGNYDRQDGVYRVVLPKANTNGEDLVCMVFKDTSVVYNLQVTPQAFAQGITASCNWFAPK